MSKTSRIATTAATLLPLAALVSGCSADAGTPVSEISKESGEPTDTVDLSNGAATADREGVTGYHFGSPDLDNSLNRALADRAQYQAFLADPRGFAAEHGVAIDQAIADRVAAELAGTADLDDARRLAQSGGTLRMTTAAACVQGACIMTSAKIAITF